jgi:hypothetical protein
VRIQAGAVIAGNNLLRYIPRSELPVMGLFSANKDSLTVLGNIATGVIFANGALLGAPWAELNVMNAQLS